MKKFSICFFAMYFMFSNMAMAKVVNPNQTYTYERMKDDIYQLEDKFDNEITVKTLGFSHFGRKILGVKLGEGEKNVVLIGAHHGREWLTSALLMKMLEDYTVAYHKKGKIGSYESSLLDDVSIWFIPMLNPDGVALQQKGLKEFPRYHRDNLLEMNQNSSDFTRWKANGMGVDLNRQYPTGWKKLADNKVDDPNYQYYKGKKPITTHETKSIVKFISKVKPDIAVAYHTAGREIYWNYHNGTHMVRDYKIAQKAAELTGYDLTTPPKDAYGAGFTDWFISKYHRPALTIEISYLVGEKNPPLSVFNEEWKRNQFIGMMLAEEAKNINNPN